jgi:hypothetical protein
MPNVMFLALFSIGSLIIIVTRKTNVVCIAAMLFYIVQKHCLKRSSYSSKIYYDVVFKDPTLNDVSVYLYLFHTHLTSSYIDMLFLTVGS